MSNKEFLYKRVFYIAIIVSVATAYLFIVFGNNVDKKYYYGFILTVVLLCISLLSYKKYRYEKDIRIVGESYGHHVEKKKKKK